MIYALGLGHGPSALLPRKEDRGQSARSTAKLKIEAAL
jgi:hypothetical protein